PVFTGISPDTGYSSSDNVTYAQNLFLNGTSAPNAVITLYKKTNWWPYNFDLIGTTTADASGNWSFDYTGTTLPQGGPVFCASATLGGMTSAFSRPFGFMVDTTPPNIILSPASATHSLPMVFSMAGGDNWSFPPNATATLDVDLNNDGDFTDPGES